MDNIKDRIGYFKYFKKYLVKIEIIGKEIQASMSLRKNGVTVLLSMVLSLCLLFQVLSGFPVSPSDTCFLRQYICFIYQNPLLLVF